MRPSDPPALPAFVSPMLAVLGRAFDSDAHLFEPKWDGLRALAFIERGAVRLRSRRDREMTPRYPELAFLAALPAGTLLDGELVVLVDERPDFSTALSREQARDRHRIARLAAEHPVSYVVFDLLYADGISLLEAPLSERRERLQAIVEACGEAPLVFSEGVVGAGLALFEQACHRGLEGIVAKRLASPYLPGKRTDAWVKVKARQSLMCAIIGYLPEGDDDLKSLLVAAPDADGALRFVGKVASGLTERQRHDLARRCAARPRAEPLVACGETARWVEPGLYCTVSFTERTKTGMLRAPVFVELLGD